MSSDLTLKGMKLGDRVEISRTFDEAAIQRFAELTGTRPSHVPEPLIAGLISYLLGVKLPGPGTNYLKQDLQFSGRAEPGETLTASVEISRLRPEKFLVDLKARCHRQNGELVCQGRSLVLARDVEA